jgi:leader peptidase (prepilin peptidase)/N-methyltransferase
MTEIQSLAIAIAVAAGGFGLLIGSFLNVVIYRVPNGMSLVRPASACPKCGHAIKGYDNIPVLSWLLLRGKCRTCKTGISSRYPLVEAGTAVFFAVVAAYMIASANLSTAPATVATTLVIVAFLYLVAITVALALIDIDVKRLPDPIVLPGYLIGAVLFLSASILTGEWQAFIRAGIGMAGLAALYFILMFIRPDAMGFGDVKLAGVLGLFLGWAGWGSLAVGAFAGFLLGGVFGIGLMLARRAKGKSGIPFGPWMLAGAWVGIFVGNQIWGGYLSLLGTP